METYTHVWNLRLPVDVLPLLILLGLFGSADYPPPPLFAQNLTSLLAARSPVPGGEVLCSLTSHTTSHRWRKNVAAVGATIKRCCRTESARVCVRAPLTYPSQ